MTTAKILEFFLTTRCTLNCKMCLCAIPYQPVKRDTPKEELFRHFALAFPLYDEIGRVELIGGEPMLHPDLPEIVLELLKYRDKFKKIRITTNGTIVPSLALIDAVHQAQAAGLEFDFLVDDYGPLSHKLSEIRHVLAREHIDCRVDCYTGDDQRGSGWLCYGDFTLREHETPEQLWEKFSHCLCPKLQFHDTHDGVIYSCASAMTGVLLGKFSLKDDEFVDLKDPNKSDAEKKRILETFLTHPTEACRYCDSFREDSPRFPAAEQLPRGEGSAC